MSKNLILLIGMPGCGKSTFGAMLSKELNYNFVDTDIYIENKTGKKVKELFKISEDYFRNIETKAYSEVSLLNKAVISSGGGIVKREENINYFKDKAIILFLDRSVENILKDIDVTDRPLLKDGVSKLHLLYKERYDLYNKYCYYKVDNNGTKEETLQKLLKIISGVNNSLQ